MFHKKFYLTGNHTGVCTYHMMNRYCICAFYMLNHLLNVGNKVYRYVANVTGISSKVIELYTIVYRDTTCWAYSHAMFPLEICICRTCSYPSVRKKIADKKGTVRISRVLMYGNMQRVLRTSNKTICAPFYKLDALMITMKNDSSLNRILRGVLFADVSVNARQLSTLANTIPRDEERELTLINDDFEETTFKDMSEIPLNAAGEV